MAAPNADLPQGPTPPATATSDAPAVDISFPVVGIGASAGGLEALTEFFEAVAPDTGMGFVVVSHLDPEHKSALAEILARITPLPVEEVADGRPIEPNHVYVIPPNRDMVIAGGTLHLAPRSETRGPHLPIDTFLRSLAADRRSQAIGVILSGNGSDGTVGLKAVKEDGGLTFAQGQTARYSGMPRSAVAAGCVDAVLPPAEIARELGRLAGHPALGWVGELPPPARPEEDDFLQILLLLSDASGVDFVHYKQSTLRRRIERRLVLRRLHTLAEYLQYLRDDPEERQTLFEEVLIPVTSFFRDPEVFDALKTIVFPRLMENRPPDTPLRIWVPGCASGEEAYSIAICLLEYLENRAETTPIKIFATNISDRSIEVARAATYGEGIVTEVSAQRLRRFFLKTDRGYQVSKTVRDLCIFARQDVTRDPPFSNLDLISCRNVLIYLGPVLQNRVLPILHYALRPGGFLLLGSSETVGGFTDLFELADKRCRFYVRTATPSRLTFDYAPGGQNRGRVFVHLDEDSQSRRPQDVYHEVDRVVLAAYAPVGVVVDEHLQVVQFRGDTGDCLKMPPGPPSTELLMMAREGLLGELRGALDRAREANAPVRAENVRVKTNEHFQNVHLEVIPITVPPSQGRYFVILFEEAQPVPGAQARVPATLQPGAGVPAGGGARAAAEPAKDREIDRLKRELEGVRAYLQSVIQQKETSNEELRAANEEIISANEELQSTNEELETAKERREKQIEESRDFVVSIVEAVREPLIVLDGRLRVRTANRAFYHMFQVDPKETEGRLLYDLGDRQWDIPSLRRLLEEVLPQKGHFENFEVEHDFPGTGLRTMLLNARRLVQFGGEPDQLILLAIEDITARKHAEDEARLLAQLVEASDDAVYGITTDGIITSWNGGAQRLYGYSPVEAVGQSINMLVSEDRVEESRRINDRLRQGQGVARLETRHVGKEGQEVFVSLTLSPIKDVAGQVVGAALVARDMTDRKRMEESLRISAATLRAVVSTAVDAIITIDERGLIDSVNPAAEKMFGYGATEMIGRNVRMLMPPPYRDEHDGYLARYLQTREKRIINIGREVQGRRKDGLTFPVDLAVSEFHNQSRRMFTGILRDISARKQLEREVLEIATLEQRRIGQQLHDSTGQELTALGLLAETLAESLDPQDGPEARIATKVREGLKRTLAQIRTFSRGLIPVEVDSRGLRAALEELASRTSEIEGVNCTVVCKGSVDLGDNQTATHLYHIAQEAVTNALRHGRPRNITICLEGDDRSHTLSVRDDGVGFEKEPLEEKGMGLKIMRYRAGLINASLAVGPGETGGTQVICKLHRRDADVSEQDD
jgi:PAS domain S-box-containing protein